MTDIASAAYTLFQKHYNVVAVQTKHFVSSKKLTTVCRTVTSMD